MSIIKKKLSFRTQKVSTSPLFISPIKEEEEKVIEEALTTPFDKVISILNNVYSYLLSNNKNLAQDIEFVISIIKTKKLYKYQGLDESFSYDKDKSIEMKNIFGYLSKFSKKKEFTNTRKNFQTSKFEINTEIHDKLNLEKMNEDFKRIQTPKTQIFDFYKLSSYEDENEGNDIIFDYSSEEDNNSINLSDSNENKEIYENKEIEENKENYEKKKSSKKSSKKNSMNTKKNSSSNSLFSLNLNMNLIKENELLDKSFNIFQYYPETKNEKNFLTLTYILLNKFHLTHITSELTLHDFIIEIYKKYSSSTAIYHTERHALDVLQTIYIYTFKTDVIRILKLGHIDIISIGISALVHDISHPGYSNDYLIRSNNKLALLYNDSHVLENFHLSETFNLLFDNNKHCNIFCNLANDDYKLIRRRMIELILSTDMSNHSKVNSIMKNVFYDNNNNYKRQYNMEEQQNIMNFLLHTADISHCSKHFNISFKWTELLNQEFWREGDDEKEKKIQVGFLCDRNNADTPRSQVGFIKGIVLPTFEILYKAFPVEDIQYYLDNVTKNLNEWIKLITDNQNNNNNNNNDNNNDNKNNNKNNNNVN